MEFRHRCVQVTLYCAIVLHKTFDTQVQHAKTHWTQSDLRFCENEGSKIFKINEKGGQLDRKGKIDTKYIVVKI